MADSRGFFASAAAAIRDTRPMDRPVYTPGNEAVSKSPLVSIDQRGPIEDRRVRCDHLGAGQIVGVNYDGITDDASLTYDTAGDNSDVDEV